MPNVFEWKTAQQVIEMLEEANAMVSGMSVEEAAQALGFTLTKSGIYVKTVVSSALESVSGATATEVAAGATGVTTTAANLALYETAGGTAAVGGLASVAVPVAVGMLGAAGGYIIGTELNKNPQYDDFMDRLLYPAFDFVTGNNLAETLYNDYEEAVPTIPMIFDASGNLFMDSGAHAAIKNFLDGVGEIAIVPTTNTLQWFVEYMAWDPNVLNGTTVSDATNITNFLLRSVLLFTVDGTSTPYDSLCLSFDTSTYVLAFIDGTNTVRMYTKAGVLVTTNKINYMAAGPSSTGKLINVYITTVNQFPIGGSVRVAFSKNFAVYGSIGDYLDGKKPVIAPPDPMPTPILKYTPGTNGIQPIKFPSGIADWLPVFLPDPPVLPGTMPEPLPVPSTQPNNPGRITPYINPVQPQPIDVPIKKPITNPTKPVVPVPNPNTSTSLQPLPKPDPNADPSQLADNPLPEQVPLTEPAADGGGTTPPVLPVTPVISSSATGLLHVYNPTNSQINEFGTWLWTTFSGDLIDTISKLFNNPMDAVIGLHELYATPITSDPTTIRAGYLDSGVASRLVSSRYTEIKCGAISVPEFWGNYLDYAPYTKTFCYLPFIGIVELNADDIIGSGVEITYKIDTYNGSCIALITTAKVGTSECVTYEFSGNCSVEIPITSGMKTSVQNALIGATTTAIAAATGGASLVGSALIGGVRGANSKNLVQHSGSFGSSYGAMGIKIPFIIVKRPKQKVVPGYNNNYGYPAHKMVLVSSCSGYLKAIEADVVSPTATEAEKKMIQEALKTGVFID